MAEIFVTLHLFRSFLEIARWSREEGSIEMFSRFRAIVETKLLVDMGTRTMKTYRTNELALANNIKFWKE